MNGKADYESTFWQMAEFAGAFTADPKRSYRLLVPQWDSSFPDASPVEREAALARLAQVLRVEEPIV